MTDLSSAGFVPPPTLQPHQTAGSVAATDQALSSQRTQATGNAQPQSGTNQQDGGDQQDTKGGDQKSGISLLSRIAFRDGQMVIQVVDRSTQNVVREYPSEKLSEIQEQLEITLGGTVDAQV